MTMTLDEAMSQVADAFMCAYGRADFPAVALLLAHLTTPPEIQVSAGEAVAVRRYRFDPYGMREDADGPYVLYTPPPPAGFMVVPVEFVASLNSVRSELADRYEAMGDHEGARLMRESMLAAHDAGGV